MISFFNTFTNTYALILNFVAHVVIFVGTFYVALKNPNLPHWHITPLWYAGLCSLFVSLTIIIQWTLGAEYPLSYWNAGMMGEILLDLSIAAVAAIMILRTYLINKKIKRMKGE